MAKLMRLTVMAIFLLFVLIGPSTKISSAKDNDAKQGQDEVVEQELDELRFRHSSAGDPFDAGTWIAQQQSSLSECTVNIADKSMPLGDAILEIARISGINQRILLSWLEVEFNLFSSASVSCDALVETGDQLMDSALKMMAAVPVFVFDPGSAESAGLTLYARDHIEDYSSGFSFAIADVAERLSLRTGMERTQLEEKFYQSYWRLFGDASDRINPSISMNADTAQFRMPYMGSQAFTSGPHGAGSTTQCLAINSSDGSGLDFDISDNAVLAIGSGSILAIKTTTTSPGRWVAIRHDNNLVSMYWHLSSINSRLYVGMRVNAGAYLGDQGNSGCAGCGEHLHLELRTHDSSHTYTSYSSMGLPVSWHGSIIDGWWFNGEVYPSTGKLVNYYGSALRFAELNQSSSKLINISCPGGTKQVNAAVEPGFPHDNETNYRNTYFAWSTGISKLSSSNGGYCPNSIVGTNSADPITPNALCGDPPPVNDTTPPSAGGFSGSVNQRTAHITTSSVQDNSGGSGVKEVRFSAAWGGQWRGIGTDSTAPYEIDWDMCSSGVPDSADIELGMEVWDNAGNKWVWSDHHGNPHIQKNYTCSPGGDPVEGSPWNTHIWMNKYLAGYTNWEGTFTWDQNYPYIWLDFGSNGPLEGWGGNEFSMRMWRQVYFPGGDYSFEVEHDDGARVYLDGQLIVDAWWDGNGGHGGGKNLSTGNHEVKVEFYENQGDAKLHLVWYGPGYPRPDNSPPNGKIISPGDNQAFSGPITLSAQASDDVSGVERVEFYANYCDSSSCGWHEIYVDYSSPYEMVWDWSSLPDQKVTLTIHVIDRTGKETMDPGGYIYAWLDKGDPWVDFINVVDNTRYNPGTYLLKVNAGDTGSGVSKVQFLAGYSDGTSDYWHTIGWDENGSDGWSVNWNSASAPAGQKVAFYAFAYDNAGNFGEDGVWNVLFMKNYPQFLPMLKR